MSRYKITYSSELMQNYLQAEIMKPEDGIMALQTSDGNALLFSIGTDGALYATVENPGTRQGWKRANLSAAQAQADFGAASGAVCKAFAVAQRTNSGIHLAMVLSDDKQNDRLYLSLGNSDADTSWLDNPGWVAYGYDDPKHDRPKVRIANVFVSEAADGEYIVVDVLRDPISHNALVSRYYIDTNKGNGYAWHAHDLAIDVEVGHYTSCLGRDKGAYSVDGIYTSGQVDGRPQLVYTPLYNVFDTTQAPNPVRLKLPGDLAPDAIAACRNADDTSDLYATAGGTLYYFAADNQNDNATAAAVIQNALFNGVRSLFALSTGDGSVMVWGLNADDQIFYTTCPLDKVTDGAWSLPLPILGGVEQVAPFVNRTYSANTFFAHTGENELIKAVKSPETTVWNKSQITLPPPTTTTAATKLSSYTTHVQVNDANNQPVADLPAGISASNVVGVYINHIYYILSPTPIEVKTDQLGSLTIVEAVHTVVGSRLTITIEGATVEINPMDKAFQTVATLNTPDALCQATLPGSTQQLVPASASDDDLQNTASTLNGLSSAYNSLATPPKSQSGVRAMRFSNVALAASPAMALESMGTGGEILVEAEDFFSWLGQEIVKGWEATEHWVVQAADDVWHFFCRIGDAVYYAVLDAVEKVVAGVQWLFEQIKIGWDKMVQYLQYLFEIDDMRRTKDVLKNLVMVYLYHQVDQIEVYRHKLDNTITGLETSLDKWAGVDWTTLGDAAGAPINSKSTPTSTPSAPAGLISHHFQGNAENASYSNGGDITYPDSDPAKVIFDAIVNEAHIVGDAFDRLWLLATDMGSKSLEAVLKELVAILGHAVLESAKNLMDATLDVLYDVAKAAVDLLDMTVHIPVISDILKDFGIPEFSILDILCWVAAAPATIFYKLSSGAAPFADDADTKLLISATDYQSILDYFHNHSMGPSAQKAHVTFIVFQFIAGTAILPLAVLKALESVSSAVNPFSKFCTGLSVVGSVSNAFANKMEEYSPLKDPTIGEFGSAFIGLRLLTTFVFSSGVLGKDISAMKGAVSVGKLNMKGIDGVTAIADAVWALAGIMIPVAHFIELGNQAAGPSQTIAILDEVAVISAGLGTVAYAVARNADPTTATVCAGVILLMGLCVSGMHFAKGGVAIAAGS